ncbi:uncharacterized protein EI90DRAFT_2966142 [Cantharellus anzutake]|uniref:uncharacterized protein n=1 Tax=Cantharellus anzutake TaxID=1750568 RepID=UPI001906223F|nr:uncharacterized protein EI90DRAFT_2966142 [Cantharellus anzutake]KAF8340331.1 hypothetical protein EI90DRAFT_2966142 [Cantharellus anzutake]
MSETQDVAQPKKLKPARKQVKPGQVEKKEEMQPGKEYNIWYNKWAGGDREDPYSNKTKSQTRCNIRRDSGLTRADASGVKYCCLFFARGCCPYGYECNYIHRLPLPETELPDSSKDCFAREKFADYRDDMGGVGSFTRQNLTLYVGRVKETGNAQDTEEVVRRHFGEWGEIDRVRILQYRSVAFVTYKDELHAQFAKEAMACQSLDNDEILNVRWATEDPNPVSKVAEKRRLEEIGRAAISAKLDDRIIDAMRSIRALEDGEEVPQPYEEAEDDADGLEDEAGDSRKRRRIEPAEDSYAVPDEPEEVEEQSAANGLLSAEVVQGLKYFAQLRQKGVQFAIATPESVNPLTKGVGGLADYGSDEDED